MTTDDQARGAGARTGTRSTHARRATRARRAERLSNAIGKLAALYEFGELQAQTDPAGFLERVAEDVARLRGAVPCVHGRAPSRCKHCERQARARSRQAGEGGGDGG